MNLTPMQWLALTGMAVIIGSGTGLVWIVMAIAPYPWNVIGVLLVMNATVGAAIGWHRAADRNGDWPW